MTRINIGIILLIAIIPLVVSQYTYGQKTELNISAYSGLFSFRGNGSASASWINLNPYLLPDKFTKNPYGKKSGFSYEMELQVQRVSKNSNIYGLGVSFEKFRSKVNIDTVYQNAFISTFYSASGKTTLSNTFISLNPFVGHRYLYRKITFDLLTGFDFAFCIDSKEEGNATTTNKVEVSVNNKLTKPSIDIRPRIQIKTQINKVGFLVSYSYGLTNYQTQNNLNASSRILRFGLGYQLK